jgi:hypothetical protein
MRQMVSIEKEYMFDTIWIREEDGTFLPAEKGHEIYKFLSDDILGKLEKLGKIWEKIYLEIEKESNNDSKNMKKLKEKTITLENEFKKIAIILKNNLGEKFDFCYWSDIELKRIMV